LLWVPMAAASRHQRRAISVPDTAVSHGHQRSVTVTEKHATTCEATDRRQTRNDLLSSGSRVRILPGAQQNHTIFGLFERATRSWLSSGDGQERAGSSSKASRCAGRTARKWRGDDQALRSWLSSGAPRRRRLTRPPRRAGSPHTCAPIPPFARDLMRLRLRVRTRRWRENRETGPRSQSRAGSPPCTRPR